ncbi:MAG: hypothetical protein JNM76_08630 [Betaproteobacteria bacterium]|nr:hypothetical protein [Betaproteobacteria bacterium]
MISGANEAIITTLLSLLFFVALGIRSSLRTAPDEDFWFAHRSLTSDELATTWSAGTVAYAVTILYYMQMVSVFGWAIFLISLLTYLFGQLLFRSAASRVAARIDFTTVGQLVADATGSRRLATLVEIAGLTSVFVLLYLELLLGVNLASTLFVSKSPYAEPVLFLLMLATIFGYVLFGGMRAVVDSDRWQFRLILCSVAVLAIYGAILLANGVAPNWAPAIPYVVWDMKSQDIASFVLFGLAVNTFPLLCQNSLWQMTTSTLPQDVAEGVKIGIIKSFLIFLVVVIVALIMRGNDQPVRSSQDLTAAITGLGLVGQHLLFPLLFVGFIAAMISTADNALIACGVTLRRLLPESNESDTSPRNLFIGRLRILGLIALAQVILFVLFTYAWGRDFQGTFLNLLFFLFGQAAPLGALVAVIAFYPDNLRQGNVMTIGVTLSWICGVLAFFVSVEMAAPKYQFLAAPISVLIAIASAYRFK